MQNVIKKYKVWLGVFIVVLIVIFGAVVFPIFVLGIPTGAVLAIDGGIVSSVSIWFLLRWCFD